MDLLVFPIISVVYDTGVLTEGSIGTDSVGFYTILYHNFRMYPVESIGYQREVLSQEAFVKTNTRNIKSICSGDGADTIDASFKRRKRSARELCAVSQFGGQEGITE